MDAGADLLESVRRCIEQEQPVALCTIVDGPARIGEKLLLHADGTYEGGVSSTPALNAAIVDAAQAALRDGRSSTLPIAGHQVFVDAIMPDPRLVIVGAVHIAVALCRYAAQSGFSVTVIDPRPALNSAERFADARTRLIGWPEDELPRLRFDENAYVAVLTHDEKFDDPTLDYVLRRTPRYVGAIGSKKTQALRRARLQQSGVDEVAISRLHAPIGLDIGAQTPEEIAIAILAEIIAAKYGRQGMPLRDRLSERIHA